MDRAWYLVCAVSWLLLMMQCLAAQSEAPSAAIDRRIGGSTAPDGYHRAAWGARAGWASAGQALKGVAGRLGVGWGPVARGARGVAGRLGEGLCNISSKSKVAVGRLLLLSGDPDLPWSAGVGME